jgi:hypothetical protein
MTTLDATAVRLPWDATDPQRHYGHRRREGDVVLGLRTEISCPTTCCRR